MEPSQEETGHLQYEKQGRCFSGFLRQLATVYPTSKVMHSDSNSTYTQCIHMIYLTRN
jgi:hypothetical protein